MKAKLSIILLGLAIIAGSCGNSKTVEVNKVSETTIGPSPESKMMIVAKLTVKVEKVKDFTEAARDIIQKSNQEPGCTYYQLFQDPYNNTKFVFVEEYKNQAAVDTHFATEYFKSFGPKIGDLIVGAPEIKVITVGKEVIQ